MTLLVATVVGFLAGRLVWVAVRPTVADTVFLRENHRGRWLPTAVGLVLPVALLVVEAGRSVAAAAGLGDVTTLTAPRMLVLVAAAGFGLLGALDDLTGTPETRGFRGHVGALVRGRLTTGGLKLVGGAALAVVVCAPVDRTSLAGLLRDAALVALAANLANLLDRRPGRVLKVAALAYAALALLVAERAPLDDVGVVVGAAMALLIDDLHERLMLGDAGANVVGGVLGLGAVLTCAAGTRTVLLVVVAVLNLVSELVSFSTVIDRVAPLRAADRWGQRD